MAIVERGSCEIISLNSRGLGVTQTPLGEGLLPYVLPGEKVEFERHEYRGSSNCLVKSIVTRSLNRVDPPCQYFGTCGGCFLQHLNSDYYQQFKLGVLSDALARFQIEPAILNPIIIIPPGQRRRLNLQALCKNNEVFLGFRRFNSHQIINIDHCLVAAPELSKLLVPLKKLLLKMMGDKTKLEVHLTLAANGIDLAFAGELSAESQLIKQFAEQNGVVRITLVGGSGRELLYKSANPYVLLANAQVEIDADCFLQASAASDQILANLATQFLADTKKAHKVVDLFCGRGTYSLPASNYAQVDGFEFDSGALAALALAASDNNLREKITLHKRDLFLLPLKSSELKKYSYAIINPPRLGAEAQSRELAKSSVPTICYVSCNPETFTRDAKLLINAGYRLSELTPVDQFYWSPHLEVVGLFSK